MAVSTERKAPVGTQRFAVIPLSKDSGETLTYSNTVTEIAAALITAKYTPKMNSNTQFASNQAIDSYVAKAGGTLDITLCGLNASDESLLFGSKVNETTGLITSNKDDVVPDVMVAYSTNRSDGTINLYKFPKVKFASQGETAETADDSGIKYQGVTLQGTYKPTINNGDDSYIIKGVATSTAEGKALETAWFASAMGGINESKTPSKN